MKVAAVVPMKLNNRRLPQKNTKPFTNGRPLCWYILSTLLEVEAIEKVYVYCSNPSIQEYMPQGVEYLRRGEDLDQDSTKMNEVLARFAGEVPADVYVMTHTTAPFVRKESIEKGLEAVLSGAYDSAFAVKELRDFLWKDGKPFNYALDAIPRTQDLEPLYRRPAGFTSTARRSSPSWGGALGRSPSLSPSARWRAWTSTRRRTFSSPTPCITTGSSWERGPACEPGARAGLHTAGRGLLQRLPLWPGQQPLSGGLPGPGGGGHHRVRLFDPEKAL